MQDKYRHGFIFIKRAGQNADGPSDKSIRRPRTLAQLLFYQKYLPKLRPYAVAHK